MEYKIKSVNLKKMLFWLFLMAIPSIIIAVGSISNALYGLETMIQHNLFDENWLVGMVGYATSLLLAGLTFTRSVLHKMPKIHNTLKIITAVLLGISIILRIVSYVSTFTTAFIPESQNYPIIYALIHIYNILIRVLMIIIFVCNKMSYKTKLTLTIICIGLQILPLTFDIVAKFEGNTIIEVIGVLKVVESFVRGLFNTAANLLVMFFALAPLKEIKE